MFTNASNVYCIVKSLVRMPSPFWLKSVTIVLTGVCLWYHVQYFPTPPTPSNTFAKTLRVIWRQKRTSYLSDRVRGAHPPHLVGAPCLYGCFVLGALQPLAGVWWLSVKACGLYIRPSTAAPGSTITQWERTPPVT